MTCLTVALLTVGISESNGQEGLPTKNESYFQSRVATNYPMLSGNRLSSVNSILGATLTGEGETGLIDHECGCGLPLLPALAQGLRDTINLIFPCRGRGLLFSERFYGGDRVMPGVIYETAPLEGPTPARSFEEVPSTEAPTTSSVLPSVTGFSVANGVRASKVRPVNYSVPSLPNGRLIPVIPNNPLRR